MLANMESNSVGYCTLCTVGSYTNGCRVVYICWGIDGKTLKPLTPDHWDVNHIHITYDNWIYIFHGHNITPLPTPLTPLSILLTPPYTHLTQPPKLFTPSSTLPIPPPTLLSPSYPLLTPLSTLLFLSPKTLTHTPLSFLHTLHPFTDVPYPPPLPHSHAPNTSLLTSCNPKPLPHNPLPLPPSCH